MPDDESKQAAGVHHVCFLLDEMSAGGVQALTIILCRHLLAAGCKVDLVRLREGHTMLHRVPGAVRTMHLHGVRPPVQVSVFGAIIRFFFVTGLYPFYLVLRSVRWAAGRGRPAREAENTRMERWTLYAPRYIASFFTAAALRSFWRAWKFNRRCARMQSSAGALSLGRVAYFSACAPLVASYMEQEKPDVVYSAWGTANIVALLGRAESVYKPHLVVSLHFPINANRVQKMKSALMFHFISEADAVHAVSRGVADEAVREYGIAREKILSVYNPAFHSEIPHLKRQPCAHPWIAEKGAEETILWVGRPVPSKDPATMLNAFRLLAERRNARLIMLGMEVKEGLVSNLIREWDAPVRDRVFLQAYVENPYSWMAGADVLVLTSVLEGLSNVLIEAMACGCPVVSTDCPHGPREILENGRWGRLTPVRDAGALADAIEATLENPPAAEELLARAMDFSEERIIPKLLEMLGLPGERQSGDGIYTPAPSSLVSTPPA